MKTLRDLVQSKFPPFKSILILFIFAFFLLAAVEQPTGDTAYWQAKVLEAHGGKDTVKQVTTLVFSGQIITHGDSGTVSLFLSRPGKLRATMKFLKRYEDRILVENKGWRNFGDGFEEVTSHSLDAMIFQYNHLNLPMGLFD